MNLATAVIPVSPKHKASGVYKDAIESVKAQTFQTDHIVVFDDDGRGAAFARNKGTAQVKTPFVIWIDADDLLRPTFVEDCIKYYRPGAYVYCDWIINGMVMNTPNRLDMWNVGQEHVVTVLLPTVAWKSVGGMDETQTYLEDEDFYRKLHAYGWCGVRCPEPLIEYRRHLGQSLVNKDVVDSELQQRRVAEKHALFTNRYRRFEQIMGCGCDDISKTTQGAIGDRQPNDVLAERLGSPMQVEGAVTKRLYPRAGLNQPIWVDEDDARARPDLFRIIADNPDKIAPDVETVKRLTQEAIEREAIERESDYTPIEELAEMTRADLLKLANDRGIEVVGTGAKGYIKRDDVLDALA